MRQRSIIMPDIGLDEINKAGAEPQSINMTIVVELMLDLRQIAAANFVISNGGSLPTPSWLEDVARGK